MWTRPCQTQTTKGLWSIARDMAIAELKYVQRPQICLPSMPTLPLTLAAF
jgi:hypothetical protein